ncbi:MAG: B12-binding domain-containing radical SAM protein [Dorea sp.]
MKILLVAINAKYIHSNLAVYSLRAYAKEHMPKVSAEDIDMEIAEYTINQQSDDILMDIYERKPDVLCLSCYIWNLQYVEGIVKEIAKIRPDIPIWLGGPEVSYDAEMVLERLPQVMGVMKGEGEKTFSELCTAYISCTSVFDTNISNTDMTAKTVRANNTRLTEALKNITGITFRSPDGEIIENPWRTPMDLSEVPFVYNDMKDFEHKIVYYETSRGCPFSCSYCLSSIDKKLRFRDLELVKKELQFFLDHKVPQVKFVDRTFNCKHAHSMAIWNYIKEHDNGVTNFHFEISADILNEEEIELIQTMRPGLIQLEIGVQSTNPDTICEIHRTMNFEKVGQIVNRIHEGKNVHQHLDLIAGLPFEDIDSFAKSFDDVYALKPHELQLGFLKVLKGSYMEQQKEEYGRAYKSIPPYEVLFTKWISYEDVLRLKGVEEMVEVYYNSRQFEHTLESLEQEFPSMFRMYETIWQYYRGKDLHKVQHKRSSRYEILLAFITERFPQKTDYYRELLTYDYYLRENAKTRPDFAGENALPKEAARVFYEKEAEERNYLPDYRQYDKNQMRKMTHLEYFKELDQIVLFDYLTRNPLNQEARTCLLCSKDVNMADSKDVNMADVS